MSATRCFQSDCPAWCKVALALVCLALPATIVTVSTPAHAQGTLEEFQRDFPDWKYKIIPLPKELTNPRVETTRRTLIQLIFNNDDRPEKSLSANTRNFDQYFQDIIFRRWTHPTRLPKISEDRQLLIRYLSRSKNPEAHARLNTLIMTLMPKFAAGNYHPAVRYNAMLLLGDLNSQEAVTIGSNKSPAKPLSEALAILLLHATEPRQIDAAKVAALIGIQRHTEMSRNWDNESKAKLINELLPILISDPPDGRTPDGHAWIQRQVIGILTALREQGAGNEVVKAFYAILVDEKNPLSLRCAASSALGILGPGTLEAKTVAAQMGSLGIAVCLDELNWLKQRVEQRLEDLKEELGEDGGEVSASEAEFLLGGSSSDSGDETATVDPVLKRLDRMSRRRLKSRLVDVRSGLGRIQAEETAMYPPGMVAAADAGPVRIDVMRLAKTVDEVMAVLENSEITPENLAEQIFNTASPLEDQVKKMTGEARPAATETKEPAAETEGPAVGPPGSGGPEPPTVDGLEPPDSDPF